jgi:hypothetical protein
MTENPQSAEQFWDSILSGEAEQIRAAFETIDLDTKQAVLEHLRDMSAGEGWQPSQRRSARAALEALNKNSLHKNS